VTDLKGPRGTNMIWAKAPGANWGRPGFLVAGGPALLGGPGAQAQAGRGPRQKQFLFINGRRYRAGWASRRASTNRGLWSGETPTSPHRARGGGGSSRDLLRRAELEPPGRQTAFFTGCIRAPPHDPAATAWQPVPTCGRPRRRSRGFWRDLGYNTGELGQENHLGAPPPAGADGARLSREFWGYLVPPGTRCRG